MHSTRRFHAKGAFRRLRRYFETRSLRYCAGLFAVLQFVFQLSGAFLVQYLRLHIVCQRNVPTRDAIRRNQQAVFIQ